MEFEYDEAKEAANLERHGLSLAFGTRIFEDPDHLIVPTIREADEEERYKAIGQVEGKLHYRRTCVAGRACPAHFRSTEQCQ